MSIQFKNQDEAMLWAECAKDKRHDKLAPEEVAEMADQYVLWSRRMTPFFEERMGDLRKQREDMLEQVKTRLMDVAKEKVDNEFNLPPIKVTGDEDKN